MSNEQRDAAPAEPAVPGLEDSTGLPLFAAAIAHEIRNPLSAVKIALQTVERQSRIPANDATRLRIALREVATIEHVLSDVLDWARPSEPAVVDILASAVLRTAAQPYLERLETHPVEASLRLRVDEGRVVAAIAELLRNAVDASPPSSAAVVRTEVRGETLAIVVENQGPPLVVDQCRRAFDPFFTTKARGIGLGLPRARQAARAHGGDVTLEPRDGGGARATLLLPLTH